MKTLMFQMIFSNFQKNFMFASRLNNSPNHKSKKKPDDIHHWKQHGKKYYKKATDEWLRPYCHSLLHTVAVRLESELYVEMIKSDLMFHCDAV